MNATRMISTTLTGAMAMALAWGVHAAGGQSDGSMNNGANQPGMPQQQSTMRHDVGTRGMSVVDKTIHNARGKTIGTVSNVLVDPASGQVTAVVMDSGGLLGVGAKSYVVPWNRVKAASGGKITVSVAKDRVDSEFAAFEEKDKGKSGSGNQGGQH